MGEASCLLPERGGGTFPVRQKVLSGKQNDVRQPKKCLVRGIMISYKFLDTQESGSTRWKGRTFWTEPLTYKLYIPPSLKIMLSVMVVVFVSVGTVIVVGPALFRQLERTTLVCGFILPCHSQWKCPLGFKHPAQDHVPSGWNDRIHKCFETSESFGTRYRIH